jgi:dienelactone hydrolase
MQWNLICILLLTVFAMKTGAQTRADGEKPLTEVLKEIETRYGVKLSYSNNLVKDKYVSHAFWRFRDDAEATLNLVLGPLDMVYAVNNKGIFEISAFQYHRRSPQEGAKHLERLRSQYTDLQQWEHHKASLQECIRKRLNLDPWPERTPLHPIYTSRVRHNGYTTENVALETMPGLFLSGTLYRPAKGKGPFPAVLLAQGHFELQRYGEESQLLAATLARMGAVVFSYDMFAKNESLLQFAFDDHRTPVAQVVQTWNSIRVADFLTSLPDVDTGKIAMTGASGGGTQTFLATALDSRISVSVPVVMVSSWFYGGCTCESGMPLHDCGLLGTNNVEIAAMAAPRPMLLVSNGQDWTSTNPEVEFPYIRSVYEFYGNQDLVQNVHLPDEGHDYGLSKRAAVYRFLALHLGLSMSPVTGKSGDIDESGCTLQSPDDMKVFGKDGERLPAHALKGLESLKNMYPFLP